MRLTSLLLAVLLAGSLYWWFGLRERPQPPATAAAVTEAPARAKADQPVQVVVMPSRAETVVNTLTLRGQTLPNRRVVVTAETEGLVISRPRRKGERVAKGDVLCRLDPGARPAALKEAQAKLAEARVEADAAERLSQKGFTPETTRVARKAALEAAQARVDQIQLDISRLEIRAPFAGTLETDAAETGARLGVGATCATVVDLSKLKVAGYVSELEVEKIRVGQPATVHLVTGEQVDGQVSYISPVADPDTRTFEVEVALPNPDRKIRAGMTAETAIGLPGVKAHRIPQSALTLDDAGRMGVRVAQGKGPQATARFFPVDIVRESHDAIWVTGLPDEAQVIVTGQEYVRDGRAIRPVPIDKTALK